MTSEFKIAQQFALNIELKNIESLKSILDKDGEFNIQNNEFESVDTSREGFLKWIQVKIKETEIYKVEFDQCLHCKTGNQVVLFNEGKFPRICKDDFERARTGLMLGIQDEKIIEIRFCYVFLKHENKYIFDCRREKIKDFQNSGLSLDEAINIALQIDDSTLF